jgi:hypothetical protein
MRQTTKWLLWLGILGLPIVTPGQTSRASLLREIFAAIPSEYFSIACCEGNAEPFIKKYVTVEDTVNGYMEGADTEEGPAVFKFSNGLFSIARMGLRSLRFTPRRCDGRTFTFSIIAMGRSRTSQRQFHSTARRISMNIHEE